METSALFFTVKFMKPLRILILPKTSGQWRLYYLDLSCLSFTCDDSQTKF